MVGSGYEQLSSPFAWLLLALIVAIPTQAILRAWIVDNTMDAGFAIGLVLAQVCGVAMMLSTRGLTWAFAAGAALLLICFFAPLMWAQIEKRSIKQLDYDDIARLQKALERDQDNASAHALLGEKLLEKQNFEAAQVQLEIALQLLPEGAQTKRWQTLLREVQRQQDEKVARLATLQKLRRPFAR